MKRIFKYALPVTDEVRIAMPKGAEILSIQVQHGTPQIWALVDPQAPDERRHFRVIGTGHPIEDHANLRYIATFQYAGGLVFHVFEVVL